MDWQNLAYALVQVVHNFGAAAIVGGALVGRWPLQHHPGQRRALAWLVLFAWMIQGMSGAGFGAVSYFYYGQFPDISGVAVVALVLKMASTVCGVLLAASCLCCCNAWPVSRQNLLWNALVLLGVLALTAAAFLRWYS
ncbi:MAG: hypothetical protein OQK94_02935 [Gammaproteobacteria bacterium]|nr:hypothetical protein [Gammaproteobacteria bacterium]MCW8839728.1 hypothetical protein [Gammaproteobacteria bacterium]MCW8959089.1 hypothetical protein [Gammaproteobacteria bacterium]MCW8994154.1 hypothetical protein [Gammaproteobacteria bacterium]